MLPPKRKGMLTENEVKGVKALASAVLRFALVDANRGFDIEGLWKFSESEWCDSLCGAVGISWVAFRRKMAETLSQYIEHSKPKRLRTYELAEVLRNGKDKGRGKSQEHRKIP